ncbi:MAG TPA: helix-turn-helix domain-containing protein, partial [Natronosporangium sp.]|nr:helix-turn-helix domain-containing protein [Natronosporangium sp.]
MRDQTGMGQTNRVSSLMRGLAILRMFEDTGQTVTVSQIARQLGIHRSNASRLAATLCDLGFLSRTDSPGRYRLGPQLPRLARLAGEPDEA